MEINEVRELKEDIRNILADAGRAVYYLERQQFHMGCAHGITLVDHISGCMELLASAMPEINGQDPIADIEGLLLMLQEIQEAMEKSDYVLLSDLYRLKLLPVFSSIQERIVSALGVAVDDGLLQKNIRSCRENAPQLVASLFPEAVLCEAEERDELSDQALGMVVEQVEKIIQKGYSVEDTSSGFFTLSIRWGDHSYYFHTNGQIVQEALAQAREWLAQDKEEYIFYGLGFGYPYLEMLQGDQNISVQVVEMNRDLLFLAMVFAPVWQLYESGRFSLLYDPTGHRLEKMDLRIDETKGFYVFYPAVHGITREHIKARMETYFVEESSIRTQRHRLDGNFRKNSRADYGSLEDLREAFQGKDVVIAAAGPSLDKNMHQLKEKRSGIMLLAVGTVLRKLISGGVRPDFVILIDSGKDVYHQVNGLEQCGIPLIFLSTVFSRVVRDYQGEKYMLCQKGYQPAEDMAEEKGWETVETGGSVVTAAFDLCLRLKPLRIIFVGLDLAYTGDMDHASGTDNRNKITKDTGVWVEGIDGTKVKTAKNLKIYKEWLEQRIASRSPEEKKTAVIDATEGGAKKRGMEIMTLQEAIRQEKTKDGLCNYVNHGKSMEV